MMRMMFSISLMQAGLTVLRLLCFAIAVLFLLTAIKAQFDSAITLPWLTAVLLGLGFTGAGLACGWFRRVIRARMEG